MAADHSDRAGGVKAQAIRCKEMNPLPPRGRVEPEAPGGGVCAATSAPTPPLARRPSPGTGEGLGDHSALIDHPDSPALPFARRFAIVAE